MRRGLTARAVVGIVVALTLSAVCLAALGWRASGGRWYSVATASMGRAAPVGTLLLTRSTSIADLRVGDIVTFHPPGTSEVYSHRVAAITHAGVKTKGDINTTVDPWTLGERNLVGKVVTRWWGMGWVLRGLPLLLICLAITMIVAACLALRWRAPTRVIGSALSVSLVAWVLHPWIGLTKLNTSAAQPGARIRVVSTGILPTRAKALHGGTHVHLVDGQVGTVHVLGVNRYGQYLVSGAPSLSFWWWVVVILVCLSPLLYSLVVGLPPLPLEADGASEPAEPSGDTDADAGRAVLASDDAGGP